MNTTWKKKATANTAASQGAANEDDARACGDVSGKSCDSPASRSSWDKAAVAVLSKNPGTYCNPINISYMMQNDFKSRESADPAVVLFKGIYYLFASHGDGYWHSDDLMTWRFIHCPGYEFDKWAPATMVIGDTLYVTHSQGGAIFKTNDPQTGIWDLVGRPLEWGDPALFYDEDTGRAFCYYGVSDNMPISVVELDPDNPGQKIGEPVALIRADKSHGFEVPGDSHERLDRSPWFEGAWLIKHEGRYFLQYAVPGTEFNGYCDGCYVSDDPMGPFSYVETSPLSYKSTGFITGAGHGSMMQDEKGNWWKFDTATISQNHMFERRLIMAPASFDPQGNPVCNFNRADYPRYAPLSEQFCFEKPGPDWHLLSYKAASTASSTLAKEGGHSFAPQNAVDETIRTWWSAETGDAGEWLEIDLGKTCEVNALQINFADQNPKEISLRRNNCFVYRYTVEFSRDGELWFILVDRKNDLGEAFKAKDKSHDYYELESSVGARYIRLTNRGPVPAGGKFAVSGLRVFGSAHGSPPAAVDDFVVTRDPFDERAVTLSWDAVPGAEGYVVRFGAKNRDSLHLHYQVWGANEAAFRCLSAGVDYYFTVDSYNPSGYTAGTVVVPGMARR